MRNPTLAPQLGKIIFLSREGRAISILFQMDDKTGFGIKQPKILLFHDAGRDWGQEEEGMRGLEEAKKGRQRLLTTGGRGHK